MTPQLATKSNSNILLVAKNYFWFTIFGEFLIILKIYGAVEFLWPWLYPNFHTIFTVIWTRKSISIPKQSFYCQNIHFWNEKWRWTWPKITNLVKIHHKQVWFFFLDIFRPYGDVVSARVYRPYSTLPNEITRWCPSVEVQDSFSAVVEYPTARCAKFAVGVLRERVQANRYRYLFEYVQKAVRQSVAIHRTGYPHDPGHMIIHNLGLFYWNQAHMKNCKDKKFQFWILNKNSNQPIRRNMSTVRANQILATNHLKSILEFHPFLILHPINSTGNDFEKPEVTENRLIHITCK